MVRKIEKNEYGEAIRLSLEVFEQCGKADFDEEGLEIFKHFIYDEGLMSELVLYGAFEEEGLVGVIGTKNEGKHISLFFIRPDYHRKGIGKALFHYAVHDRPSVEMTVSSSTYAVPFYQSLGFVVIGEKQTYKGLSSVPMRRYEAIIAKKSAYTLRTWHTEDAPSLAKQLNNKKIWDNCRDSLPYPYTLENARDFIDMIRRKEGIHDFCIEVDEEAVGNIGFVPESDVQRFSAEIGYLIGEPYWNRGIVTDAVKEAVKYYFDHTEKVRLFASVFEGNIPSMRVLEKAGFTKIGVMRKAVFKNGRFLDTHYYEKIREKEEEV